MPYEIKKSEGSGYEVVNTGTGEVKARHATKDDAERQVRLLRGIEDGWEPTGSNTHTHEDGTTHGPHNEPNDHTHGG